MSFFENLFNKKKPKQYAQASDNKPLKNDTPEAKAQSIPKGHSLSMGQLGIDIQVVLHSEAIDNKELIELYASLISEKYGVKTKVSTTVDRPLYYVAVYRIDLDLIENLFNPTTNRWVFRLDDLMNSQAFDIDEAINSTESCTVIAANLSHELQENDDKFKLLAENQYYRFYKYFGNTLLRHEKQTEQTLVVGRFVNIAACVPYHGKLYIAENSGLTGDKEIYHCELSGTNLVALHCLSNEKVFRAGHLVSMDSVKEMHLLEDFLEIVVTRNDGASIYDYKIIITEKDGTISMKQGF